MNTHRILSHAGIELVRRLAQEGDRLITLDRARAMAPAVGLSAGYLRQALHHLVRSGWLVRLRPGLYALASSVPGTVPIHEFEVAMALVRPAAISHWSALHYHGLTDQLPRRVFVLTPTNARVSRLGQRAVGGIRYQFVQVHPARFFGVMRVWIGEARVTVTDPERTLLDGLRHPAYCGDFAEVLQAFEVRRPTLNVDRIIRYAMKLGAATAKRLGWILERQGVASERLRRLAAVPVTGYRLLDPSGPRRGPCHRRWMIQDNLSGRARR